MKLRLSFFVGITLFLSYMAQAQVAVDNTLTVKQLVEDYLLGEGVEVQNITINGQGEDAVNAQAGLYTGVSNFINFETGIVMTTALANIVTGGGCLGTVSGNVTITVDEPNDAGDDITQTYCGDGSTLVLSPEVDQPTNGIFSPASIILSSSYSGIYIYTVADGACAPDVANYTIDIHEPLSVTAVQASCELDSTEYTVTFAINGGSGIGTYSVNGVPIDTNIFISSGIPISDDYSFVIDDEGPCGNITTSGSAPNCSCPISATFASANHTICIGSSVEVEINLNGGVEGQYEFVYSDGTVSDTISGASDGHILTLNPTTTTTYTLQSVMDTVCIGNTNSTLTITVDQLNNAGNDVTLDMYCGDGSNFVFTPALGEPINGGFSPASIALLSSNSGDYLYMETGGQCPPSFATYTINIADELTASAVPTCQPNQTQYTTQISITGGTLPYFVNGAQISGSTFISPAIALGADYNFVISDSGPCDNVNVSGTLPNCSCSARANFASGDEKICEGSDATIEFNLSGGINGLYGFVYSDGTDNYTVSEASNGHTVTVSPSTTTTYTLVSVTGGLDGNFTNHLTNDPDLMAIAGQSIYDEIIIEFDFKAVSDSIKFNYVFASNEYPGYTCSQFNDAFGFFVSGPGINGPFMNNAENIALIPDTDVPVAINTVNGGVPTGIGVASNCLAANPNWVADSQYFVLNNNTPQGDVQFPGMTQTFTALAGGLQCGEWYHIKLAIGDAVDGNLDSGVFLEAGSFAAFGDVFLTVVPQIGGGAAVDPLYDSVLVAGCSEVYIELTRPKGMSTDSIFVEFGGTAIQENPDNPILGADYLLGENDTLFFFPEGVDTIGFTVTTIWDEIPGENEYITITINYQDACGEPRTASDTLYMIDPYFLNSSVESVTLTCPTDKVLVSAEGLDGIEPYLYDWGDYGQGEDLSETSVDVQPGDSTYYQVSISDICAFEHKLDSVLVINNIPDPLQAVIDQFIDPECPNGSVDMHASIRDGNGDYQIIWEDGKGRGYLQEEDIRITNTNNQINFTPDPINFTETLPVYLTVKDTCGTIVRDTVYVNYPFIQPLEASFDPLKEHCPSKPIAIKANVKNGSGDFDYGWGISKGSGAFVEGADLTADHILAVPGPGVNEYTLAVSDNCGRKGTDYEVRTIIGNDITISRSGFDMYSDTLNVIRLDNIMNIITPNGDDKNDYFAIEGVNEFEDSRLEIYDRWGRMIFSTDYYPAGQIKGSKPEGAFDANGFEDGTYFYVINVNSGECVQSGTIEVLRGTN